MQAVTFSRRQSAVVCDATEDDWEVTLPPAHQVRRLLTVARADVTNHTVTVKDAAGATITTVGYGANLFGEIGGEWVWFAGPGMAVGAPAVAAVTSGTAFQPRAGGPCAVSVIGTADLIFNLSSLVTVSLSPTQNGTYTAVSKFALHLGAGMLGVGDSNSGTIPVPAGWWVKAVVTGTAGVTLTRTTWNL